MYEFRRNWLAMQAKNAGIPFENEQALFSESVFAVPH